MRCDVCRQEFEVVGSRALEPGRAELVNGYGGLVGRMRSSRDACVAWCVSCEEPAAGAPRGNWTAIVELRRDDSETLVLEVACNVSGRHRPAFVNADPDRCYEAEVPEVEPVAATEECGRAFNLARLSKAEDARLMNRLYAALADDDYADGADHDDRDGSDDE